MYSFLHVFMEVPFHLYEPDLCYFTRQDFSLKRPFCVFIGLWVSNFLFLSPVQGGWTVERPSRVERNVSFFIEVPARRRHIRAVWWATDAVSSASLVTGFASELKSQCPFAFQHTETVWGCPPDVWNLNTGFDSVFFFLIWRSRVCFCLCVRVCTSPSTWMYVYMCV